MSGAGAIRINGASAGEGFGTAVVADGRDIWVAAPNRKVSGHAQAGAIAHYRVINSTAHLIQTLTEDTPGVPGTAAAGDHFGEVLANWNIRSLAVGMPSKDIGGAVNAGAFALLRMDYHSGLMTSAIVKSENSSGVAGTAAGGDHFGASIGIGDETVFGVSSALTIVVGAPGARQGTIPAAGRALCVSRRGRQAGRPAGVDHPGHAGHPRHLGGERPVRLGGGRRRL